MDGHHSLTHYSSINLLMDEWMDEYIDACRADRTCYTVHHTIDQSVNQPIDRMIQIQLVGQPVDG